MISAIAVNMDESCPLLLETFKNALEIVVFVGFQAKGVSPNFVVEALTKLRIESRYNSLQNSSCTGIGEA